MDTDEQETNGISIRVSQVAVLPSDFDSHLQTKDNCRFDSSLNISEDNGQVKPYENENGNVSGKGKGNINGDQEQETKYPKESHPFPPNLTLDSQDSHKFSTSSQSPRGLQRMGSTDDLERQPYDDDPEQSSRIYEKCVSLSYLRGSGTFGSGSLGSRGPRRSLGFNYDPELNSPGAGVAPNKLRGESGDLNGRQLAENLLAKRNREERLRNLHSLKSPPPVDPNQPHDGTPGFSSEGGTPIRESGRLRVNISPASSETLPPQPEQPPASPNRPTSPRPRLEAGQANKGLQKLKQIFHKKSTFDSPQLSEK